MATFRRNDKNENSRNIPLTDRADLPEETVFDESEYDDGFDDLNMPEEESVSEEELHEIRGKRFHFASGAGNFAAMIAGAVVILVLLAFLMNMISFVLNDADRNFTLFQNRL